MSDGWRIFDIVVALIGVITWSFSAILWALMHNWGLALLCLLSLLFSLYRLVFATYFHPEAHSHERMASSDYVRCDYRGVHCRCC